MPVSHISLTVSHLPTSCSFFLAALAPLGYRYLGQEGDQIAFGIDTPEFFISQEKASVKAGAAHVAFTSPSRGAVDAFFTAALKAGGRMHKEPTERDPDTGYYSAGILDFDDNSIEATYRHEKATKEHHSVSGKKAESVLSWQKDVARSTVSHAPLPARPSPRVIVTNVTKPTIMVANPSVRTRSGGDVSSKSLIGTLLGAAAGAAVAYAMTRGEENGNQAPRPFAYQAVGAANSPMAPSAAGSKHSYQGLPRSRSGETQCEALEYPRSQLSIASQNPRSELASSAHMHTNRLTITAPPQPQASTLIETFAPPSEVPRYRRQSMSRAQTDGALRSSRSSRTLSRIPSAPKSSHVAAKTFTQAIPATSRVSSVVTEVRHPRDVPLPSSQATSIGPTDHNDLRRSVFSSKPHHEKGTDVGSIAPSDSVSQAGSKRSKDSHRSSRHKSRGHVQNGDDDGSHVSEKTVKSERRGIGKGRASGVDSPMRSSSNSHVHKSVVSFLPGM
ncbi:MAG: hypothetical protein Q9183_000015 [Haloplaca sp. 2 TL-2023]